jgi:CheY-like chemotaxis protein
MNGREVLSLAEAGDYDLLLLDIHMPGLDGFGVVGAIRERERTAGGNLPVVALTARSRKDYRTLPGGRHGRIPDQAGCGRRPARGHRPAGLGPWIFPAVPGGCRTEQ